MLVENRVGLESWLDPTIRNSGNPHLRVVVCGDGLPVVAGNPHLWMDPVFARAYVGKIRDALIAADAAHAPAYRSATAAYQVQLDALRTRTQRKIATLPPAQRGVAMVFQSFALLPWLTVRLRCARALVPRILTTPTVHQARSDGV